MRLGILHPGIGVGRSASQRKEKGNVNNAWPVEEGKEEIKKLKRGLWLVLGSDRRVASQVVTCDGSKWRYVGKRQTRHRDNVGISPDMDGNLETILTSHKPSLILISLKNGRRKSKFQQSPQKGI
jgi:hypothetical protein